MRTARFKDIVPAGETRRLIGPADVEITGLAYRHQDVADGSVFVAIKGTKTDGHSFIPQALEGGAKALIVREAPPGRLPPDIAVALVDDPRRTLAKAAARFYGHPSRRMPLVGITGTNGKTTVAYMVESILRAAGMKPAVIGTINYRLGDDARPAPVTTPESVDIERMLDEMLEGGADSAVIEVSSHALEQGRVEGLIFAARVFTNISRDHLDYHENMEAYFQAKARLFSDPQFADSGPAAINADDPYGAKLLKKSDSAVPFGIKTDLDGALRPIEWSADIDGVRAAISAPEGVLSISTRMLGEWNLYNALAAIAAAHILKIDADAIERGIGRLQRVPGRLERVDNDRGVLVVVDYSHTPDSLQKALQTLRKLTKGRVICVFGCGGDRDRGKRPIMGEIGVEMSDMAIVTSDNPRTEDPISIIDDILAGIHGHKTSPPRHLKVEPDRRAAIFTAIEAARPDDTVLIAGKGHEDYQILGTERIHFDDREVAMEALGIKVSAGEGASN